MTIEEFYRELIDFCTNLGIEDLVGDTLEGQLQTICDALEDGPA